MQPRKELEAITPLQPQQNENLEDEAETPMNTTNSESEDTDVAMPNLDLTTTEQKGQEPRDKPTGGVKRKTFGTPVRTQASRRTKVEPSLFKRPTSPPLNPKKTKTLKKSESKL